MAETLADLTLFMGVPLLALAAVLLWWLVYKFRNPVTFVIALAVTSVMLHSIEYGLIFKNNDTIPPWIDLATSKVLTRATEYGLDMVLALAVLGLILRRKPGQR